MGKRTRVAKGFTAAYAGYKWIESHTDDVQKWCDKAVERSRGKSYGRYVEPPARVMKALARWIEDNNEEPSRPPALPKQ